MSRMTTRATARASPASRVSPRPKPKPRASPAALALSNACASNAPSSDAPSTSSLKRRYVSDNDEPEPPPDTAKASSSSSSKRRHVSDDEPEPAPDTGEASSSSRKRHYVPDDDEPEPALVTAKGSSSSRKRRHVSNDDELEHPPKKVKDDEDVKDCSFKHDLNAQKRVFPPGWWKDLSSSKEDAYKMHVNVTGQLKGRKEKVKSLVQSLQDNDFELLDRNPHDPPEPFFDSPFKQWLSFIYPGNPHTKVAADAIFTNSVAGENCHNLAYVDLDYARAMRRFTLGQTPESFRAGQHATAFVGKHQPPPDDDRHDAEDPYVLAVLLGLAQKQREDENPTPRRRGDAATRSESLRSRSRTTSESPGPEVNDPDACYTVRVVAIPEGAKHVYFYTASFPMAFLQKLYEPSKYSHSGCVTISYFRSQISQKKHILQMLTPTLEQIVSRGASYPPE
ncbi:unnamed protein product [Clonostachys rosea]|uniref:Uncharacterized protein n=1 Tax=Bionectria ochroleuca TaxID=29856 RepID=A0ABY6UZS6_BIOOC|nr:unnamed protein product [Clonostachys rosea]